MQTTKTTTNRPGGFPTWVSDVKQDMGPGAAPGTREVKRRTIATDYASYGSAGPWARLGASDRAWWRATLEAFHAARVEVATLPYERRRRVEEAIAEEECELSDWPMVVRRAIEATR
jgi:hypothetical protein